MEVISSHIPRTERKKLTARIRQQSHCLAHTRQAQLQAGRNYVLYFLIPLLPPYTSTFCGPNSRPQHSNQTRKGQWNSQRKLMPLWDWPLILLPVLLLTLTLALQIGWPHKYQLLPIYKAASMPLLQQFWQFPQFSHSILLLNKPLLKTNKQTNKKKHCKVHLSSRSLEIRRR